MEKVTVEDLDALVAEVFNQRIKCDQMGDALSEENKKLQYLESKVTSYLKELGRKDYKTPLGSISVVQKWRVNNPKDPEARHKFYEFLREKGIFEELVSVNSNTLNAFYKKEMEIAREQGDFDFSVPGIEEPKLYETVTLRRAK